MLLSESRRGDESLAKFYYELGLKALKVYDFTDALIYFSKAYSEAPESEYGELAYLYYGKAYALYSYELGRKEGILASLGYLNQYTFYYKFPRFWNLQKEFVGDGYLLIGWYEDARNLYAEVYGAGKNVRLLLKYAYASALLGDGTVVKLLGELKEVPPELLYLKHLSLGIAKANLGDFGEALSHLEKAYEKNNFLSYDPHYNFYRGLSHKKLGKIREGMFYLERARRLDRFGFYTHKLNYHLFEIYLTLNDYGGAYEVYKEMKEELAYNPFYQIAFLKIWLYPDFMEKFREEFRYYYELVRQLFWWKLGSPVSNYAVLALLNRVLKSKSLDEETRTILRVRTFRGGEFVLDNELFDYKRELQKLNDELQRYNPYIEEDVNLVMELYSLNDESFLNIFKEDKSHEILVRSFVYKGDKRALEFLDFVREASLRNFLKAKYLFSYGSFGLAEELFEKALKGIEGIDKLEAYLLLFYIRKSPYIDEVVELAKEYKEMEGYFPIIYRAVADIYYKRKDYERAKEFYEKFVREYGERNILYWVTLAKLGVIADKLKDEELRRFVVAQGKDAVKPWKDVILSLWGE